MAGANESPRNKLIALMYLVFITMLALNVSKEVLNGFGQMYKKVQSANSNVAESNQFYYDKISANATEKGGKWIGSNKVANDIKKLSSEFYKAIQDIKDEATVKAKIDDPELNDFQKMDKGESLDVIFFDPNGLSEGGKSFVNLINNYKAEVNKVFTSKYPQYQSLVAKRFYTGNSENLVENAEGQEVSWLSYNYEGFPLISSLAKLTFMQYDIRLTETDVLNALLGKELEASSAVNKANYITFLKSEKGAYYQGEKYNGEVILGRKGGAQEPNEVNLKVDGRALQPSNYEKIPGGVRLNINSGNPGDHKITGDLIFLNNGIESKIPVDQEFAVISKPNAAVISADKMNVVFRGVDNPMTITIPGIAPSKVNASAAGLKRVKGSNYVMKPGKGREVKITATGTLPDGKKITTSSDFRIKDIPRPTGKVRGQDGTIKISKNALSKASITAELDDFDFDIKLKTLSFKFKVPGQATISVNGSKLNSRAKTALNRAKPGQSVQIFDIKVQNVSNPGYRFKKVSPVICEITN